ncbi:hypothetical protein HanRHA438_Chr12g0559121 [Helianthus annuus]|nr:hypothetical protein HanRHA438_Chr12g0559121 [Helianthus annuus]
MFIWSPGTLCGHTLYFTISESWNMFINVVIAFNTITEQIIEHSPIPPTSIYQGVLANVQDSLQMLQMTIHRRTKRYAWLWTLNGDRWYNVFSTPPVTRIPFSTWVQPLIHLLNHILCKIPLLKPGCLVFNTTITWLSLANSVTQVSYAKLS